MAKNDAINPKELQINMPDALRAGVYANITNITATPTEFVFNFIFASPQDTPNATMVSRVIVNRKHATEILDVLKGIVETTNEVNPQ